MPTLVVAFGAGYVAVRVLPHYHLRSVSLALPDNASIATARCSLLVMRRLPHLTYALIAVRSVMRNCGCCTCVPTFVARHRRSVDPTSLVLRTIPRMWTCRVHAGALDHWLPLRFASALC